MQSTLAPKETDPNDKAATKPDAVPTARADRAAARPAREVRASAPQDRPKADVSAGKSSPAGNATTARGSPTPAARSTSAGNAASAGSPSSAGANATSADKSPSVGGNSATTGTSAAKTAPADKSAASADATVRAAAVDNSQVQSRRPVRGRWARRARMGLVFALCAAALAGWLRYGDRVKAYGDTVKTMVAKWVPGAPAASPPQESAEAAEQPGSLALQADAADQAAVPGQPAPSVAASSAAPPETAQLLQSMSQQIEQLRAGMEDLKAGQDQIFRYMARNPEVRPAQARTVEPNRIPEPNLGPGTPARPLRTATAAPGRKPKPVVEPALRPPLPLR
jgi:hypothetical protein